MFTILVLAAVAADVSSNPLEPAARGQLECSIPDLRRKTCAALTTYLPGRGGEYTAIGKMLLADKPRLTLEITLSVRLVAGTICGRMSIADLELAKVTAPDRTFRVKEAAPLLAELTDMYEHMGMLDKEICATHHVNGQDIVEKSSVDGLARPDLVQRIRWVKPEDGFRLIPLLPNAGEHVEAVR
jgi:hypothetical protein